MSPRIPLALQSVFLRSQAGEEVHDAPEGAVKTFGKRNIAGRILAKVTLPKSFRPRWHASKSPKELDRAKKSSSRKLNFGWKRSALNSLDAVDTIEGVTESMDQHSVATTSALNNSDSLNQSMELEIDLPQLQEDEVVDFEEKAPSPKDYLDEILLERGYSTSSFTSTEGGYICKPTPLQQASYGMLVLRAVRESNTELLKSLLQAGISPNPCNVHGESLIHMACRRGDHAILRVFLEAGCSIQVTDDYGRTPLHDACWCARPAFEVVELLVSRDPRLFYIKDSRGSFPLDYVKSEAEWGAWKEFFDCKKDTWFPPRDLETEGPEPAPPLTCHAPFSRQLEDPEGALPVEMAAAVADGKLSPLDALMMMEEDSESDYSDDDMSDSSYDSDYDSEDDDDSVIY